MGKIQEEIIAELCGAITGDGWIQSNERGMFLAGDPTEDKDYYDFNIQRLFDKLSIITTPKHFPYWKVYGFSIYSGEVIKRFLGFGLPKGRKAHSAEIPPWILKSSDKIKMAFIRGLFDADGCVWCQKDYTKYAKDFDANYHTKIRIRFTSISYQLQNQLQNQLSLVGFKGKLRTLRNRATKLRNNKDIHIVEINRLGDIKKFFNTLKPSNEKHNTKYLIWKEFGFCPPKTTIKQRKDILKKKINPYDLYVRG